ncbi:hypothetical protein HBH1_00804 [Herbaspirillum sp. BH-1]|uniref:Preprotein translocase subunit SecG n=1 Tax=Herbaspirillum frisingense TaxID=92645 RepID=A0ABU1PH08_9BURK|nr:MULTISPECIES: hypothetical protein [Herbaspirillum]MDR6585010.1 preprotein translocase subunit SecG [Herbaspirillum frisingense]PLY60865.1 hypothetical protein HBH1_00804 [Herbaspirillum sp. BH-1]
MDGLDRITLVLLVVLVVVALLFPLTEGRAKHRERQRQDKREN